MKKKEIPVFEEKIIETHCHLDYLKEKTTEEILDLCLKYNIDKLITISVDPTNLSTVRDISKKNPMVYFSQGVHPHNAKDFNENIRDEIILHAHDNKMVAIGEIGLDYYYNNSEPEIQKDVFTAQVNIAKKLEKPMIIHSRDAEEDTMAILDTHCEKNQRAVIHSFTSSLDLARYAIDRSFYLGFNGIITFKNAENVREAVAITPLENILLETDSPFLAPTPYRGVENAPYYLPFIAQKIAEIKNIDVDEVIKVTSQNAENLFRFTEHQ